jgi:hypothetical protein
MRCLSAPDRFEMMHRECRKELVFTREIESWTSIAASGVYARKTCLARIAPRSSHFSPAPQPGIVLFRLVGRCRYLAISRKAVSSCRVRLTSALKRLASDPGDEPQNSRSRRAKSQSICARLARTPTAFAVTVLPTLRTRTQRSDVEATPAEHRGP